MSKFDSDLELATTEEVKAKIQKLRRVLRVSFHAVSISALLFVLVAEIFPEQIAKPLVIGTVILNGSYHAWCWSKIRRVHR